MKITMVDYFAPEKALLEGEQVKVCGTTPKRLLTSTAIAYSCLEHDPHS